MNFLSVAAALLAVPLSALAADPAEPDAAAPPLEYRSAFEGIPQGVEEQSVDWKKANTDVARFPRGHADLLKWEEGQNSAPAGGPPAAGTPAAAPTGQAPAGHGHQH